MGPRSFLFVFLIGCVHRTVLGQINRGVSCNDIRFIVNLHNDARRAVAKGVLPGQPKASNMAYMVWDDALAAVAQKWADRVVFEHNDNRWDRRFSVGENIYGTWTNYPDRSPNWNRALRSWIDEYAIYTFAPIFPDRATGHYTQIVWATTLYVGCGFTAITSNGLTTALYVCNYGPSGNYKDQYAYKIGYGCENLCCYSDCSRSYGYWCS